MSLLYVVLDITTSRYLFVNVNLLMIKDTNSSKLPKDPGSDKSTNGPKESSCCSSVMSTNEPSQGDTNNISNDANDTF